MIDRTRQLIEELLEHLNNSQGDDLHSLVQASKKPMPADPVESDKPDGLAIEKVSVMGKPVDGCDDDSKMMADLGIKPGADDGAQEDDMSDDELKELLAKYLH